MALLLAIDHSQGVRNRSVMSARRFFPPLSPVCLVSRGSAAAHDRLCFFLLRAVLDCFDCYLGVDFSCRCSRRRSSGHGGQGGQDCVPVISDVTHFLWAFGWKVWVDQAGGGGLTAAQRFTTTSLAHPPGHGSPLAARAAEGVCRISAVDCAATHPSLSLVHDSLEARPGLVNWLDLRGRDTGAGIVGI